MDRNDPKFRRGAEVEAFAAIRSWAEEDKPMSGEHPSLLGPWTASNPLPVVQVAGPPPNVQGYYPPTAQNPLPVTIVTMGRAGEEGQPAALVVEDVPDDGKLYARMRGRWVAIVGVPLVTDDDR